MYKKIEQCFNNNYSKFKKSLTEISIDKTNKRSVICDTTLFFNYDEIVKVIAGNRTVPKSPDMIDFFKDKIVLTEFKSGNWHDKDLVSKAIGGGVSALFSILKKKSVITSKADFINLKKEYYVVATVVFNNPKNKGNKKIREHRYASKIRHRLLPLFLDLFYDNCKVVKASDWQSNRINTRLTSH